MTDYFKKLQNKVINYKEIPEFNLKGDFEGIKAITYDGAECDGKKTKVFAYIGYPEYAKGKAPAVILVHGGGGRPFPEWIKMWNERGYVAIAMSTTGDFPQISSSEKVTWHHGMYGLFEETEYTDAPNCDDMRNSEKPLNQQWMYHAVSRVISAHNILRCDEKVDENKIGIVGISWGGVITSIVLGYDNRFAFAVPIYGSGYLTENKGTLEFFKNGKNPELWLAEKKFSELKTPVLWLCWNKDSCFSVNSNSKSYKDTVKNNANTRLSIVNEMYHDHPWGWVRKEPYAFADFVCKNGKRLPALKKSADRFEIINPDNLVIPFVKMYYLDEVYSYTEDLKAVQEWKIVNLDFKDGVLDYEIPGGVKAYYIELTTLMYTDVYITCSELVEF